MTNFSDWIGGTAGVWSDSANWDSGGVPDAAAGVTITAADDAPDTIAGTGTEESASLELIGPITLMGRTFSTGSVGVAGDGLAQPGFVLAPGATLTDSGSMSVGDDSAVTVNGGTLTAATLVQSLGTINLNGGSITVGAVQPGALATDTSNTYDVTGGVFTVTGSIAGGANGAGDTFNVSGGAFVVEGSVALGSDTVSAVTGGVVQFASVNATAGGADTFTVDSTSSIEIGGAGAAQAGALTIDAGSVLTDGGWITARVIVDNGTIEVGVGESLVIDGTSGGLIGTGAVQIDAQATATIAGVGDQSANSVVFAGPGAELVLSDDSLSATLAFTPTISGFDSTDLIVYVGDVSGVSYSSGVLTLSESGATVATLNLAGDFTGDTFAVADVAGVSQIAVSVGGGLVPGDNGTAVGAQNPAGSTVSATAAGSVSQSAVAASGDTTVAPVGTSTPDVYVWTGVSGSWDSAANWSDTTAGQTTALLAPGSHDAVTIAAPGSATIAITGIGNASSLTLGGSVDVKGTFATALATVQSGATVTIDQAASVTTSGDFNDYGASLTVSGGSLSVGGNWNEGLSSAGAFTNAAVSVTGNYVQKGNFVDTFTNSTLNVKGALALTNNFAYVTFNTSTVTVNGGIAEQGNYSGVIVNGGTVTIASISAANAAIYGVYQVTAGLFKVNGNDSVSAGDDFYAGGTGKILVAGVTTLGSFYLQAYEAGSIQLASVSSPVDGSDTITVSGSASIEFGATGGAQAGSFTLDAGVSITEGASITAPHIVLAAGSTLKAGNGETLNLATTYSAQLRAYAGDIAGAGALQIGAGARLNIHDQIVAGSTVSVGFAGTGGVLALDSYTLGSGVFAPTISGFGSTDHIVYNGALSAVAFSSGVLTLSNNGTYVGTLKLAGDYSGSAFSVAVKNNVSTISVSGSAASPQVYVWNAITGSWASPANWSNQTSGTTASVAPGSRDTVTIASAAGVTDVVTGTGTASSLTLGGSVTLNGQFTAGLAAVNSGAAVIVGQAASVTTGGDFNDNGATLTVSGGSLGVGGNWNENANGALTNATVSVTGAYSFLSSASRSDTFTNSTLKVSGAADLGNGDGIAFNNSSATISGGIVEGGSGATVALNGGTLTVASIGASSASAYGSYSVSAGLFKVTGADSVAAGDEFAATGTGQIVIAGSTSLGAVSLQASGSGSIRLASVSSPANGADDIAVAGSASIEFGATGGAQAGSFTLDAGVSITEGASITAPHIVLAAGSTLAAGSGETLNLAAAYNAQTGAYAGDIAGAGALQIGAGASLDIHDQFVAGSTVGVGFVGTGGVLALDPATLSNGSSAPTISGFGPTDQIVYNGDLSAVAYSGGVVTLSNNGVVVGTLNLAGSYAGDTFVVTDAGGVSQIAVSIGGDTATAPAGTTTADQYVWRPDIAGSWDNAANWSDTTAGQTPAKLAPGAKDLVTIAAPSGGAFVVTGAGASASLTLANADIRGSLVTAAAAENGGSAVWLDSAAVVTDTGDFVESGSSSTLTVNNATLSVAGNFVENGAGAVNLVAGAVTFGGVTETAGSSYANNAYTISGGTLTVTGSFGGPGASQSGSDSFNVSGAGRFVVGGTLALGQDAFATSGSGSVEIVSTSSVANSSDTFNVGAGSSIEIGPSGAFTAGSFTLDAGQTITDGGSVTAANTIVIGTGATFRVGAGEQLTLSSGSSSGQGSTSVWTGGLAGAGTLEIDANASLTINGVAASATDTINFAGAGGTLTIAENAGSSSFPGNLTLAGFAAGDTLQVQGIVTDAAYIGGALVLYNNGAKVGAFNMGAAYAGAAFDVAQTGGYAQVTFGPAWLKSANANFATAADWSSGAVPGAGDSAAISGTTRYTVSVTAPTAIRSLEETDALATVSIAAGSNLTLSGVSKLGGVVAGAGTLALTGGSTSIASGGALLVSNWTVSGAGTNVSLGESLNYVGTFSAGAGTTLTLSGGNLVLYGAATFAGTSITATAHTLKTVGTTTVSGLTIGGTMTFYNIKTSKESGGSVTLGDSSGNVASLFNASTGTWNILDDSGVGIGSSASSSISNCGLFEKTGGTGTSVIAANFTQAHSLLVSSGTLDFQSAVTGTGTDTISGPSTLEFDSTISSGQSIAFSGAGGTLSLGNPLGYAGSSISGFAAGDFVDLAGSWSLLNFSENAAGTAGTLTLASGTSQVALQFAGAFSASSFNVTSGAATIVGHT